MKRKIRYTDWGTFIFVCLVFAACGTQKKAVVTEEKTDTVAAVINDIDPDFFEQVTEESAAGRLTQEGKARIAANDYPGAIDLFTQAIAADSTYLDAYFERATAYYTILQYEDAARDDNHLYKNNYPHPVVYARIGQRYAAAEQWAKALEVYKKGISLADTSIMLHNQMGNLQVHLGQFQDAVQTLERALELGAPETPVLNANLGYSYSRIGENRKAVFYLTKSIQMNPTDRMIYAFRGFALLNIREFASAESDYKFYLEENPGDVIALYNLGKALYEQKKYEEAIPVLERVSELQPEYMDTYYLLGVSYGGKNDYKTALTWLDKAIAQQPDKGIYYYNRGIAKGQVNRNADFCPDFRKALELGFSEAQAMIDLYCR